VTTKISKLSPTRWRFVLPPEKAPFAVRSGQGIYVVGFIIFVASTVLPAHKEYRPLFDSWLYDSLTMLGALIVAARGWSVKTERLAWSLLALGMAGSALGDLVSTLLGPNASFPSIAEPFYLSLYPCSYAALVLLIRAKALRLPAGVWLDGLTCALALAGVAAAVAFGPILAATDGSAFAVAVGLAYPLGDLVLIAMAAAMLVLFGWHAERRLFLIGMGFMLFAAADSIYLLQVARDSYVQGTWIDGLWPAGTMLSVFASWRPTRKLAERRLDGLGALATPMGCMLAAVGILVTATRVHVPTLAVTLAALTLFTVGARLTLSFRDVISLAETRTQARTDELTGLANRRALVAALGQARTRDADGGEPDLALLLIDLDKFKEINDSLGHHVGDELLRQLASRLQRHVRPGDLLARLGGDEFAILLAPGSQQAAAEVVAQRMVGALDEPFALDDLTLHVRGSIGVALWPLHCADPLQLLQRADVAMYTAKSARTRLALYNVEQDPHSRTRVETLEALRTALTRGELVCHYQPKVYLADGVAHSAEALVRWQHPERGLLSPDEFIPLAEQAGLMRPLTLVVLEIALRQVSEWRSTGYRLSVAVNLSVTNLLDADLPSDVSRLLSKHELPAEALILEITETVLMADSSRAKAVVEALHALGVGLSDDDYGTGYSSLAYLQDLAIDELKLDRSFVRRLSEDPRSAAIVRSTVDLAHSLGLRIVAEGVEDRETLLTLDNYGCDVIQGYFFSRPLPTAELTRWLDKQSDRQWGVTTGADQAASGQPGSGGRPRYSPDASTGTAAAAH
jgi:diguanylate cyclase (GGDEF)-like protein